MKRQRQKGGAKSAKRSRGGSRIARKPFAEAREFARSLGLRSTKEWEKWSKSGARPDDHAWVQLDVANAFPRVSRRAVLEAVAERALALLPLATAFLRRASNFVFHGSAGRGVVP